MTGGKVNGRNQSPPNRAEDPPKKGFADSFEWLTKFFPHFNLLPDFTGNVMDFGYEQERCQNAHL
jgi:hypothetical protein